MDYRNRLLNVLTLPLLLLSFIAQSQIPTVKARPFEGMVDAKLAGQFTSYGTYHMKTGALVDIVHDEHFGHSVVLDLPGYGVFSMELFENPLQAPNYLLSLQRETGLIRTPGTGIVKTFQGNLKGGQYLVSLTIDHGFIYGFIQLPKNDMLRIEPLRFHLDGAAKDDIIAYRTSDQILKDEVACEVKHHMQEVANEQTHESTQRLAVDCRTVQIAFADDWLMYVDYNQDVDDVENHNMGVLNDVQTNYDTEFEDDLMFEVVEIWISTCSSCDPWTNSTNAGALLDDFTDWGPSGFDNTHDVADLWTDRDFNGPTIGVSWLDAVCTSYRYLTTQDFSTGGGQLRTLLAHELGHNFGSNHDPDGSQTIMAPSLIVTNNWSASSINQINSYINGINCLSFCVSVEPPIADFSADDVTGCDPFTVHFFDESTGPPSAWEWTFPGGTPSSSTQQNPTVTYNTPGVYDVVLEVTNTAGTNTLVRTDYITVLTEPIADFTYDQIDLSLIFTNLSDGADSWFWEFGDGGTSMQENPTHTYDQDGEYEISLTVSNDCGEDNFTITVEVFVPPVADFSYNTDVGCAPLVVQFINESSDNVQYFEWLFPGGIPASSTQENPVVTYHNPGFYDVTLIVENIAGVDELHINNLIEVLAQPEADFNFAVNGYTVQFVNASLDADDYLWAFGDGGTSSASDPLHIYQDGGSYQVTLTATNDCGSDMHVETVVLNSPPVADFITSVSSGCAPLSVTYTSTSLGLVTSYNWSFPGGSPSSSTAPMPTVIYHNPGTYDARLIVGNNIGFDTLLLEDIITVHSDPVSDFTADIDGATVDFLNNSTDATSYNWMIDGNNYGLEDLTYTFDEDGDYPVQLIATGPCGSDTSVQIIHIATPPVAGFASNITDGCQPLTVQFFNTSSSNATTFAWVFEGGTPSTSSEENPVVQYVFPGVFDVQLTVWSEVGTDILAISELIEVNPLPVALFSTVQTGLQIDFTNLSLEADQYFWMFGDGTTSDVENPNHTYGDFGMYTISLISQNSCGSDTLTVNLSVSGAPVPVFSVAQTNGCVPFEVQFMDMSQNGPLIWEWSFPGGLPDTSNLQNPVIVYFQPGVYPVTLRVSNAGGAQALVRDEYIHAAFPPMADFSVVANDEVVNFTNLSQGADQYFWTFGDGGLDTALNPVHVYTVSGTYQVQLIAVNACSADTITRDITVTVTAVDDVTDKFDVIIYPNPNEGQFTIVLDQMDGEFELDIYDLLGKLVLRKHLESNPYGKHEMILYDPAPGVYSVLLRKGEFRFMTKMVVL